MNTCRIFSSPPRLLIFMLLLFFSGSLPASADMDEALWDLFWGSKRTVSISPVPVVKCRQKTPAGEPQTVTLPGSGMKMQVQPYPEYTDLFHMEEGWIGGDGDYSLPLSEDKTLWLYGDSFLGLVQGGRRCEGFAIVNNCLSVQTGKDPATASMEFYCGRTEEGTPSAVVTPDDGRGWFWIFDGIKTGKGLYLFLIQTERDRESALGFRAMGMSLGCVNNPDDPPQKWTITQKKIPFCQFRDGTENFPGSAVLRAGPYIYLYGIKEKSGEGFSKKHMTISRAPLDSPDDFSRWEFFDGAMWQGAFEKTAPLCGGFANEYTVSWQQALKKYVAVYTECGASANICLRTAPEPEGPWSEPVVIYRCPESLWHKNVLLYAAKAHPSLSAHPDELIISYIANSLDFSDLLRDARHYFPQFLRVTFMTE